MRGPDCTRRVATCAPTPCMQHSIGVPGMAAMRGRPPRCAGASLRRAQATACAYLWPALHELGRELLEQLLHPLFLQVLGVRRSTTGRHPRSPTAPRRSASARGAAAAHPRRSGGSVGRSVGRPQQRGAPRGGRPGAGPPGASHAQPAVRRGRGGGAGRRGAQLVCLLYAAAAPPPAARPPARRGARLRTERTPPGRPAAILGGPRARCKPQGCGLVWSELEWLPRDRSALPLVGEGPNPTTCACASSRGRTSTRSVYRCRCTSTVPFGVCALTGLQ